MLAMFYFIIISYSFIIGGNSPLVSLERRHEQAHDRVQFSAYLWRDHHAVGAWRKIHELISTQGKTEMTGR